MLVFQNSLNRCSVKKVFLEISQNSQENICARASFLIKTDTLAQVFSCEFCEICNNTFSYRTPLVDASACEEDLTEKNWYNSLTSMQNDKSPIIDGLTKEF